MYQFGYLVSARFFTLLFAAVMGTIFLLFVLLYTFSDGGLFVSSALQANLANASKEFTGIELHINSSTYVLVIGSFLSVFIGSGVLLMLYQFFMKQEAQKRRRALAQEQQDESVYTDYKLSDIIDRMPTISFLELSVFVWICSLLLTTSYFLFTHFELLLSDNANMYLGSVIFGLLGGALASLKFFIPGEKDENVDNREFSSLYSYKYLASPFVSGLLGFFTYLSITEFHVWELTNGQFAVVLIIVGYYSEQVFRLMFQIMSKITKMMEKKFETSLSLTNAK